jgi:hypothetical protein
MFLVFRSLSDQTRFTSTKGKDSGGSPRVSFSSSLRPWAHNGTPGGGTQKVNMSQEGLASRRASGLDGLNGCRLMTRFWSCSAPTRITHRSVASLSGSLP